MAEEGARVLRAGTVWPGAGPGTLSGCRLAVSGGRIASMAPEGTAPSLFAMPAFVDAHCHLLWIGFRETRMDLSAAACSGDLLEALAVRERTSDEPILRGEGWDEGDWGDPGLPSLGEIDQAAGGRPAFLRRLCGHSALVSSATMELLANQGAFRGLSGPLIREEPVLEFDELFPPDREEMLKAFEEARSRAWGCGVTALRTLDSMDTCSFLASVPDPRLRLSLAPWVSDGKLPGMPRPVAPGVEAWGVKVFLDGSIGALSAAMTVPYSDGSSGSLVYDDGDLSLLLSDALASGLRVAAHAIGGCALRQLDRVSGELAAGDLPRGATITVEHAEELEADWPGGWRRDLHGFSMQPNFVRSWQSPGGLYSGRLPGDSWKRLNPFSLPSAAGFRLGFGSDSMPLGPLWGLRGALDHPAGSAVGPLEALTAYTTGAADICGFDDLACPLAPGRPADIVVLSGSPFRSDPGDLSVVATIAGGTVVSGDPGVLEPR